MSAELVGDAIDLLGLAIGGLADLLLLGDHRVLRVREQGHRDEQEGAPRSATVAGWREKRGRNRPAGASADRAQRIAALPADEPVGLGGFVERV